MRKIVADSLFDGEHVRLDTCLILDDGGTVLALEPATQHADAERLTGTLCPGFVNIHCHLELSHLAGSIAPGHGMAQFAAAIISQRDAVPESTQATSARQALDDAWASGTVAIGDISNRALTAELKRKHPLYTHTFVEALGVAPARAQEVWQAAQAVQAAFEGIPNSIVPHAPYSVSVALQQLIAAHAEAHQALWCMHFMESAQEYSWMAQGIGPLGDLLQPFGATSPLQDPVAQLLQYLPQHSPSLLIHCTTCAYPQLAALAPLNELYFGLCPRSNVYIHGEEPNYELFPWASGRVCLGTDSLASNHDLSMWNEVAFLANRVPMSQALQAATANGADFLQLHWAGRLLKGKSPGVVYLDNDVFNSEPTEQNKPIVASLLIAPKADR